MKNKRNKIAIIEDQILFAEALKELLLTFDFISEVDILALPNKERNYRVPVQYYDLILVDINMPYMNGFEVSKKIKDLNPFQKVALLSAREDRISIAMAKELEIEGFLFKSLSVDILREAISKIVDGHIYFQDKSKQNSKEFVFQDGTKAVLTDKEIQFLELLLLELTSKEIADKMFISEHTVIGYRKILFQKFQVRNMVGLVKYALELKLR